MAKGIPIFNTDNCTLLLGVDVNLPGLNSDILSAEAKKNGFEKKKELHITVLGFKNGSKVKEVLAGKASDEIRRLAEETEWSFSLKPTGYKISKDYSGTGVNESRESIISMVELKGIFEFYEKLNALLDINLEIPPAHITLYTKGSDAENSRIGIGIESWEEFRQLNPELINTGAKRTYSKIILPTRPQPDTLVAIFILKKYGERIFPGIKEAETDFWQVMPEGETEESLDKKGIVLIDLGGGRFDHHAVKSKTTASDLISFYLEVSDDPALAKLIEYARRDDFYGKGTISPDPIDRAFGLSALIAVLNKSLVKDPAKVIDIVFPILVAHHNEESKRTKELPLEFEAKLANGEADIFSVKQRDKKLKVVLVNSESGSLAGYLRSQNGGRYDVVAQWLPTNHVNILTRPTKRIDLRSLTALLRLEEATASGKDLEVSARDLARFGRLKDIPEWYYDPATNSVQNGGLNPKEINPTKISREKFRKIMELGLSEQIWDPRMIN